VERKVFNHDDCSYHDEVIKYKASKYIIIEGLFTLVDEEINS
jgi:uridine kinase